MCSSFTLFFFTATATTEIYTLSLHDALPISHQPVVMPPSPGDMGQRACEGGAPGDRKSTRLNSSHVSISYAVFCLKKKINIDMDLKRVHPIDIHVLRRHGHELGVVNV